MNHTIIQDQNFRLSQSHSYPLPGYLFVESESGAHGLNQLQSAETQSLVAMLQTAEQVLNALVKPERIYILRFGESDERVHFHIIPRTKRLLSGYLAACQDTAPFNGASITAWLWSNAETLGYSAGEIGAFVDSARRFCGTV